MNDLLKRLNMEEISPLFDEYFLKVEKETELPEWLTEKFILEANEKCNLLPTQLENVLTARKEVEKNSDLVMFSKVLYEMLKIDKHHTEVFDNLAFPKAPQSENPIAYDMVAVFPMLAHLKLSYFKLLEKGIDESILKNSFHTVDGGVSSSVKKTGKPAFSLTFFNWSTLAKNCCLFRIDRFNFEILKKSRLEIKSFKNEKNEIKIMMKEGIKVHESGFILGSTSAKEEKNSYTTDFLETDEYYEGYCTNSDSTKIEKTKTRLYKNEWTPFIKEGDDMISLHIPSEGSFDKETVDKALKIGKEFIKKFFPEISPAAYICFSWLLAPELKNMLRPDSNILSFQKRFTKFPLKCYGGDVFTYVFSMAVPDLENFDFNTLPQDNSLKKSIKEWYLSGKIVHETGGIFPYYN